MHQQKFFTFKKSIYQKISTLPGRSNVHAQAGLILKADALPVRHSHSAYVVAKEIVNGG